MSRALPIVWMLMRAKRLKDLIDLGIVKSSPAIMHMFNRQLEKIYKEN
jgi:hypothetical protein